MNYLRYTLLIICLHYATATQNQQSKRDIINSVAAPAHIPTRHTVTEYHNRVPIPVPQPIPIPVPRGVPYTVPIGVPVERPRPVPYLIPHPVAHFIPRPIAVPIDRPFPYPVAHPVPVTVMQGVGIPVPQPYAVGYPSPVPVRVPQPVPIPVGPDSQVVQNDVPPVQTVVSGYGDTVLEANSQSIVHPY